MRRLVLALAALIVFAAAPASAKVLISVDKSAQRMTISVDGETRWVWPVSTGRRGHATPVGTYQAFRMEEDHYSREWDDAPMPHSIYFTKRGHAIHGSYDIKRLGSAASAGCVRLHPDNARQLFALVKAQGVLNTTVIVSGEEPRVAPPPAVARQQQQQQQRAARPAPRYEEYEYEDEQPRTARRQYRPPAYQQPAYGQRYYGQPRGYGQLPSYYRDLPPPPPGYMYAPPPPQGYYYYYR